MFCRSLANIIVTIIFSAKNLFYLFRALADTDADGKMDINEFSIACKLINLKLRGFDVPKVLPPQLLASLKSFSPPAIPPLPNPALISSSVSVDVPKIPPVQQQPPLSTQMPPLLPGIGGGMISQVSTAPTGIIPPMPSTAPLISGPPLPHMIPTVPPQPLGAIPPIMSQPVGILKTAQPNVMPIGAPLISSSVVSTAPFIGGVPALSGAPAIPTAVLAPLTSSATVPPMVSATVAAPVVSSAGPSATSTPRASVTSIDRTASIESP